MEVFSVLKSKLLSVQVNANRNNVLEPYWILVETLIVLRNFVISTINEIINGIYDSVEIAQQI